MLNIFLNATDSFASLSEQSLVVDFMARKNLETFPHEAIVKVLIDGKVDPESAQLYFNFITEEYDVDTFSLENEQYAFMLTLNVILHIHYTGKVPLIARTMLEFLRNANDCKHFNQIASALSQFYLKSDKSIQSFYIKSIKMMMDIRNVFQNHEENSKTVKGMNETIDRRIQRLPLDIQKRYFQSD